MSKAIITITDSGDDDADIKVEFGSGGIKDGSSAHYLAVKALAYLVKQGDAEGEHDVFLSEFTLFAGEFNALLNDLIDALGGEKEAM